MKKILLIVLVFSHLFGKAQTSTARLDSIIYSGSFNMNNNNYTYRNIKVLFDDIPNKVITYNNRKTPESEYLQIYNEKMVKVFDYATSSLLADCNSALITDCKCKIADSSIEILKYTFWTGRCINCAVGIIYETYKLNREGFFEMTKNLDKTFVGKNKHVKYTKREVHDFEQTVLNYNLLTYKEKMQLISLLKN